MANYNLVSNAVVEPISLERFMQPVLAYTQARDAMEEKYGLMLDEASRYEAMKDTLDNDSYLKYKEFKDIADSGLNAIMSSNFTPLDKAKLMQARRSYAQNIKPLNEQFKKREEEAQMAYKAKLSNPYLRLSRDPRNTPLSQYSTGMPDIQVLDGTQVIALGKQLGTQFAQRLMSDPEKLTKSSLAYQYISTKGMGASPEQFLAFLAEDAKTDDVAAKYLKQAQDLIIDASGINNWADGKEKTEGLKFTKDMANIGLSSAIGASGAERVVDSAQASMDDAAETRKFQAAMYGLKKDHNGDWVKDDGLGDTIDLGDNATALPNGKVPKTLVRNKTKGQTGWIAKDKDGNVIGPMSNADVSKYTTGLLGASGKGSGSSQTTNYGLSGAVSVGGNSIFNAAVIKSSKTKTTSKLVEVPATLRKYIPQDVKDNESMYRFIYVDTKDLSKVNKNSFGVAWILKKNHNAYNGNNQSSSASTTDIGSDLDNLLVDSSN